MSMTPPKIETDREAIQRDIKKASTILYDVAKGSYGPQSGNMILGFRHGPPLFSHDGVTNLKMVRDEDPFVDDIIQAIRTSSEQNNQKAGDGTTAVVILAHHLIMAAQRMEGLGISPREIVAKLKEAEKVAFEYIDSIKKPIKDDVIEKVATTSANDPELGALIADVMKAIGKDGGVVIESYEGLGVHPEIVDGFYFGQGYRDTTLINDPANNQSNHFNVPILISSRKLATNVDVREILNSLQQKGIKEIVLLAETSDEVAQTLALAKSNGVLLCVPVDPPFISGSKTLFLDDIALLTGAKVYEGVDFDPAEHLGFAKEILVTESSTTILGGDADKKQAKDRIKTIRQQLKEETHPQSIDFAKQRLARLVGKMAKIKVGGALEFERDELKLRIQDAVSAVQSALKEGVLPGGGTTLARVKGSSFDDTFEKPFKILMENAGYNPDVFLGHLEATEAWMGFNLNNMTTEPQNMLEAGVIDAVIVIQEVVRNAISVAVALIMSGTQLAQSGKD